MSETMGRDAILGRLKSITADLEQSMLPASAIPLLDLNLTVQQLKVLTVLVTSPTGESGRSLSATFGVSMATMSGLMDRLVARGVAERSHDPGDARVRRIVATELGRAVVKRLVAARPEFNHEVLAGLSLAELHALELGMSAVARELGRPVSPAVTEF